MRNLVMVTFVCMVMTHHARADFLVKGAQPAQATNPGQLAPAPTPSTPETADDQPRTEPQPAKPRFKMAYGFGKGVPLAFACRQIVPKAVRIIYGPGTDSNALVDWKGGDTWNHVLRDAVQPLGLHLVMTTMAVEIRE